MAMSNAELARHGFAAAASGDFDVIADLLDPEVKWHAGDPAAEGSCQNRQQALQWMRTAAMRRGGAMPDLVDVVEAAPNRVVVIMRPARSSGDSPPRSIANVATFRAGRVVEIVHFPDAADALASVAAAPPY
jgi:ketosteroid isomerase-like protein